jgi:dienelactone hydrolase
MVEGSMAQDRRIWEALALQTLKVETGPPHEGDTGQGLVIHTDRGQVRAILHQSANKGDKAVLWVWGARGGYAGPAEGIFANLAEEFTSQDITSLRLNYREPGVNTESVLDALCGLEYLKGMGYSRVALVGHSFGGAVVIATAVLSEQVVAVVSLSPQTYGASGAPHVSPRPLLLVHGMGDTRLPPWCSEQIHQIAREPKELVLYPGAEHGLLECKDELHDLLRRWIPDKLGSNPEG